MLVTTLSRQQTSNRKVN